MILDSSQCGLESRLAPSPSVHLPSRLPSPNSKNHACIARAADCASAAGVRLDRRDHLRLIVDGRQLSRALARRRHSVGVGAGGEQRLDHARGSRPRSDGERRPTALARRRVRRAVPQQQPHDPHLSHRRVDGSFRPAAAAAAQQGQPRWRRRRRGCSRWPSRSRCCRGKGRRRARAASRTARGRCRPAPPQSRAPSAARTGPAGRARLDRRGARAAARPSACSAPRCPAPGVAA
mmetsp:Transcript_42677/g.142017  ORF Transcript_42677/g.142017 Transcript_42677/m.142017 type:complete len:235 (-) Transcript_42677:864-1568(-)